MVRYELWAIRTVNAISVSSLPSKWDPMQLRYWKIKLHNQPDAFFLPPLFHCFCLFPPDLLSLLKLGFFLLNPPCDGRSLDLAKPERFTSFVLLFPRGENLLGLSEWFLSSLFLLRVSVEYSFLVKLPAALGLNFDLL